MVGRYAGFGDYLFYELLTRGIPVVPTGTRSDLQQTIPVTSGLSTDGAVPFATAVMK